jgi:hypothetical protein
LKIPFKEFAFTGFKIVLSDIIIYIYNIYFFL